MAVATRARINPALMALVSDAPTLDEADLDEAQDRLGALARLPRVNRKRREHGLEPLTEGEFLAELERDRLRRVAREAAQDRYGRGR